MLYIRVAFRRFGYDNKLSYRLRSSCYTVFMQPNEQPQPETTPAAAPQVPPQPAAPPVTPDTPPPVPEAAPPVPAPAVDPLPQQPLEDAATAPPAPALEPETEAEPVSPEEAQSDGPTPLPGVEPVQWQAPEYLQHDKTPLWYVGFAAVVVVLMAAAMLLMRSWTFAILIPVMAVALMVYSHRPPRQLNYVLSEKGIHINDQLHPMGEFKAFGVIQEAEVNSLVLVPVKRFRPSLTIYFSTDVGERIVDLLGGYLPMKDIHPDAFDKIIRKLHI